MPYDSEAEATLPNVAVQINSDEIRIELKTIAEGLLFDQGSGMVSSIGCLSNPGGPGC